MSSFFQFSQGSEALQEPTETSPLLGRFRAVPPRSASNRHPGLHGDGRGSIHIGHGALVAAELLNEGSDDSDSDEEASGWRGVWKRWVVDLWVEPQLAAVKSVVERWWSRYSLLVLLPAMLAVAWCSVPFPKYPLPYDHDHDGDHDADDDVGRDPLDGHKTPGHGTARVKVNFWFFLFVYYSLYNLTALIWITKVFNLYRLNWWPKSLGFPLTVSLIAVLSLAVPIPVYMVPETRFLTLHNLTWISWSFIIMAMPVAIAFVILMANQRHLGLRHSLSETQRIFTTSWWTGEPDFPPRQDAAGRPRRQHYTGGPIDDLDPDMLHVARRTRPQAVTLRRTWLPSSFVRFLWFCVALLIGLLAYVLGEAYAEIYLRTLPHNSLETVVYVYGWVATVHLLDALTGWVLGGRQGERVDSYPLSWVFKLYFMLTYQTYVRALYARLRSPEQFVVLQLLSSMSLVVLTPLMMTRCFHWVLTITGMCASSYASYQKMQARNVFIRFVAENVSMAAFLGSIVVLHFGANKDAYPYFAFDDEDEPYGFGLTITASAVTWACELVASLAVRALIRICFAVDVEVEGKLDIAVSPELLPTSVAVILHVLQNMLFSIIRLQFYH